MEDNVLQNDEGSTFEDIQPQQPSECTSSIDHTVTNDDQGIFLTWNTLYFLSEAFVYFQS